MTKERIGIIALVIIIIILLQRGCEKDAKIASQAVFINAMTDTLTTYTNKDGQQVAKIAMLETERVKDFLVMDIKDAEIKKLQDEVKKNKSRLGPGGAVVVVSGTTEVTGGDTSTTTMRDTVRRNDTVWLYPEYSGLIKLGWRTDSTWWVNGDVKANRDSTTIGIKVDNAYTVVIGREKAKGFKALFKPKIPFVEITNENPFTTTSTMRAYRVKAPKPKRFGIGINVGYGLTFDKNYQPIFRPYIGVGLNYNIIEFF